MIIGPSSSPSCAMTLFLLLLLMLLLRLMKHRHRRISSGAVLRFFASVDAPTDRGKRRRCQPKSAAYGRCMQIGPDAGGNSSTTHGNRRKSGTAVGIVIHAGSAERVESGARTMMMMMMTTMIDVSFILHLCTSRLLQQLSVIVLGNDSERGLLRFGGRRRRRGRRSGRASGGICIF